MNNRKCILYIEHAGIIGGSVVSLKELIIDAIQAGYECHVICTNLQIATFFASTGAIVHVAPVVSFTHNTAYYYKATPFDILRMGRILIKIVFSFYGLTKIINK